MNPDSWYANAETFIWRGYNIQYKRSTGEKPWLVLIHGFPSCSFDWWKVWEPLSRSYQLLALDMIGFGRSDKPPGFPYSIMRQADLHMDLLAHLRIDEFHILAHDYGDTVAQELVARSLENEGIKLLSVCLLNGGIFPESHHPLLIQKMLMSPIGFLLSRLLNQKKFEKSFGSIFGPDTQLSEQELQEYWELVAYQNGHRIAHKIIRYMRERVVNRERWVSALQNCPVRLGLINGPVDPISGEVMVNRFKEIISEEHIWLLERIGHYPQVEAPDQMLEAYSQFINAR